MEQEHFRLRKKWNESKKVEEADRLPSTSLLSPHFLCSLNEKKLFRAAQCHSAHTEILATQAKLATAG